MKSALISFAAFATVLLVGASVKADPVIWSYQAYDTEIHSNNQPEFITPLSSIKFAGQTTGPEGNSGIVIYKLTTHSFATDAAPDSFSDVPFTLKIGFVDTKAALDTSANQVFTNDVVFTGKFSATNVTTKSLSATGISWDSPLSKTITLGGDGPLTLWRDYTVTVNPAFSFSPPGGPNGAPGSIYVDVQITPGEAPGGSGNEENPTATPEPASLVLAALGLPLVVLMRRRLKKAQQEASIA